MVFVSHDIDEVTEITDRATILRDGALVGVLDTKHATAVDFVERIVGRAVKPFHVYALGSARREPAARAEGVAAAAMGPSRSRSAKAKSSG